MKIKYSPSVNPYDDVSYAFDGDKITVTVNKETDTYDFSSVPNDSICTIEHEEKMAISTPITARRDADGVLWVELYKCIGNDATEAEKFPDWEDSP